MKIPVMVEPKKEHTVREEVKKSFINFAVSEVHHFKQTKGMASSASTRHIPQQLHFIVRWIKDSIFGE